MWRHRAALAAIFLLAAVLLYLSLRGIQWRLVAATIASIQPRFAALAVAVGLIPMLLRAARWRILLEAEAAVSFKTAFWAVAAGYFGNNFLPARGGELVRSYIVRERSALSGSYVLATALSERVADAVALVVTGGVSLLFVGQRARWMETLRGSFLSIGLAGVILLACLPWFEARLGKISERWPRIQQVFRQVARGVRSLHDPGRLSRFVALTGVIWMLDAVSTVTMGRALAVPITIPIALLLIVGLSLSSAFPSTPGYVGVYQFVAVMVLGPFGISKSSAIAFIVVTQAFSYAVTAVLGLLAMTRYTPFSWRGLGQQRVGVS